jgi:Ran GTPase-activating protein (RanGAP) involved in mRNA processing and transport
MSGGKISEVIKNIIKRLKQNDITLTNLDKNKCSNNELIALAKALTINHTLTTLNLSSNIIDITNDGSKALSQELAKALKTNTTLTSLNLSNNRIRYLGAIALAQLFKTNTTLTILNLSDNYIGNDYYLNVDDKLSKELADALIKDSNLTKLNLSNTRSGQILVKAFAEALKENKTLIELDISSNLIGNEGATALADALKTNSTLTTLIIYNNKISDDGAKALADALKTNSTLTTLDISKNNIGDELMEEINEYIQNINDALAIQN